MTNTRTSDDANRTADRVLKWATAAVVCAIFALTAHGNYGYGSDVMHLNAGFALAVVGALDVLQIVGITAAFRLAHAPFRIRFYAWLVFGAANASSIAANLADAQARGLPWQGFIGAGWFPFLLSLGVHLAVVTWRHTRVPGPAALPLPVTPPAADAGPVPQGPPVAKPRPVSLVKPRPAAPPRAAQTRGRRTRTQYAPELQATIVDEFNAGKATNAQLAALHGVPLRTVQLWTAPPKTSAANGGRKR